MDPTLFYWIGGVLAVLAVAVSFLGLRDKDFPGSRGAIVGTLVIFLVLVLGSATYAVVNARDEQEHREAEVAEERELAQEAEVEELEAEESGGEGPETASSGVKDAPAGEGVTEVAMEEYSFDPADASVAAGETVTAVNDGQTVHNLTVLDGDEELGKTEDVDPGQTGELEVNFDPGEYEMVCTIPGHADLGMDGTFAVE